MDDRGQQQPAGLERLASAWLGLLSRDLAERPEPSARLDQETIPRREGSWWPAWESWLASRAGEWRSPPAMGPGLCDAPGSYVLMK